MNLFTLIIVNLIFGLIFIINFAYLIYKLFIDVQLDQTSYVGQELKSNKDYTETSVDPVIHDQLNLLRTKFQINFLLVELSAIILFVFWGIILFYKISIN